MFLSQVERYETRVLYRFPRGGRWESCTGEEILRGVREIALGLISLGVKKGDRVAILSSNRVEWSLIDWADICIGALTVPIYPSTMPAQISHILDHSGSTFLFIESAARLARQLPAGSSLPQLRNIILIDSDERLPDSSLEPARLVSLRDLQESGRRASGTREDMFEQMALSLRPEDDLTIIYTSGTTGEPKGVLTTHGHYLFMLDAVDSAIPSTDEDVTLQFLPFAHSFGRLEHFMVVAKGYTGGFARSVETIAKDLLIIRPTILFSVPRIYENAYSRIRARVAAGNGLQRLIFRWGRFVGQRAGLYQSEGKRVPVALRLIRSLARRLVYSHIRAIFGGRLRFAISGGAPLAPEIAEFFHSLDILILEGYGLTETSTVSHVNRPERYRFGTVGLSLDDVECAIGPDGEILLRGPNVFKGYYRDPEGSRDVIDAEGWFHTGDVGEIDGDGFLRITDRKKDIIVTSGGKNVAPQRIENLLKTDPMISQVMIIGDQQPHLTALITLDREQIQEWAIREGLKFDSAEELASHPRVVSLVRERIRKKNKELAAYESVRNFRILPHDLTVEREELTPTLKLRRKVIVQRHKDLIGEMLRKPRSDL